MVEASFSFSFRLCLNRALAPAFRLLFSSATRDAACTSTGSETVPEVVSRVII